MQNPDYLIIITEMKYEPVLRAQMKVAADPTPATAIAIMYSADSSANRIRQYAPTTQTPPVRMVHRVP